MLFLELVLYFQNAIKIIVYHIEVFIAIFEMSNYSYLFSPHRISNHIRLVIIKAYTLFRKNNDFSDNSIIYVKVETFNNKKFKLENIDEKYDFYTAALKLGQIIPGLSWEVKVT